MNTESNQKLLLKEELKLYIGRCITPKQLLGHGFISVKADDDVTGGCIETADDKWMKIVEPNRMLIVSIQRSCPELTISGVWCITRQLIHSGYSQLYLADTQVPVYYYETKLIPVTMVQEMKQLLGSCG